MSKVELEVGAAVAEWDTEDPLRWEMSEILGLGKRAETKVYQFDFTKLQLCYSVKFLLALKMTLINRRLTAKLVTIDADAFRIRSVLIICQDAFVRSCMNSLKDITPLSNINRDFLLCLWAVKDDIPPNCLETFKCYFKLNRYNYELFDQGLSDIDFPVRHKADGNVSLGAVGRFRKNVLSTALSRATLVNILNVTESGFESGELSLDLFAYSRLLLSRAARPESFRLIRLKDLHIDAAGETKSYYLSISVPKSRLSTPPRVAIRLHPDVGKILDLQRSSVAERFGYLVSAKNAFGSNNDSQGMVYTVGDLPLFPAGPRKHWKISQKTKDRLGLIPSSEIFLIYYSSPLQKFTRTKMTHTALRHTLGTQLAIAGCSAMTIAAVLLHATYRSAREYVDLIFSGAIDELSDSLEPAFLEHFPVIKEFSTIRDEMSPAKKIVSLSSDKLHRETTGECGRDQICQYAPITCYECPRYIPCYDADHTINLNLVQEEIESARSGGLPRAVDVRRYTHIANRIRIVIAACIAKRESCNLD